MKKFVVVPGIKYYFFNEINEADIYVEEEKFLSSSKSLLRLCQRLSKKLDLWFMYYLFTDDWKIKLLECDCCIVFDQAFSVALIKSIKKINPKIKVIVYMWNPTFNDITITDNLKKVSELISIYSFDKNDCMKYGYSFSPMIYNFKLNHIKFKLNYDVVFVGYLKNRAQLLSNLYLELESINAKSFFYVLDNINIKDNVPFVLQTKYLDYNRYKEIMLGTRAVLDIVQENQIGLTIRTMETLCYGKKLITNNLDIITYDFYNKKNIFVIGLDDIKNLGEFINSPFENIPFDIIKKYNFIDWVKSFE